MKECTVAEVVTDNCDPMGIPQHDPGAKMDRGKDRWSLLPWKVLQGVVQIMTFGAKKYTDHGWKEVPKAKERYWDALLRHKMLMDEGFWYDDDSGLPHWAHMVCNAVFLGYFYMKGVRDDSIKRERGTEDSGEVNVTEHAWAETIGSGISANDEEEIKNLERLREEMQDIMVNGGGGWGRKRY